MLRALLQRLGRANLRTADGKKTANSAGGNTCAYASRARSP
ncbi:hypothetical protein AB0D12_04160 [Streptomyces sp. NPDC048479]